MLLQHIEWHFVGEQRYLRIWVSGKTGRRRLIAKHRAMDVLRRLHDRHTDIAELSFETTLTTSVTQKLFRTSTGYKQPSLNGTFRRLMRDTAFLVDVEGETRTLYSLRQNNATMELFNNKTSIHALSRQMGNSAAMLERQYSKLTAAMAADRLT